jgi:hypothetical protein
VWVTAVTPEGRSHPPALIGLGPQLGSTLGFRKARPFGDSGVIIGENACSIRDAAGFAGTQACGSTFIVAGLCGIRPVSVGLASLPGEAASEAVYKRLCR